ncbi:MAG: glycosyltransferase [Gemmatimonadales bacterium]
MASTLHIALYHPGRLPVRKYGGTERVVVWLARGLAELGHKVTLLAAPGSHVPETTLVPVDPKLSATPGGPDLTALLPRGVDLLHAHVPLQRPPSGVPFLWTFHGNGDAGREFPDSTVALSANHAARHGITRWVHNGLDPAEYQFLPVKQDFDLFLGRLHTVKGWRWAVEGARECNRKLVVAGGWRPSLRPGLRFAGEIGGSEKVQLLADAACLWMPALWDEPFGLTTIEAMVSGTPVLGTHRGALPEVITATSGAMGDTLEELVSLRAGLAALDPEGVRARVLEAFTHRVMAERYVELYRGAIGLG